MAAEKGSVPVVDYKQLNSLSSVVLYDTSAKRVKRGKFDDVERIIERRKKYILSEKTLCLLPNIFQTVIITDTHSVLKSLKEIRKRSVIVLQFRSTEQMQVVETENIFCFPRNYKATMVMFAGQKYRQFHGYPMDLCSTRKSVLF